MEAGATLLKGGEKDGKELVQIFLPGAIAWQATGPLSQLLSTHRLTPA